MSPYNPYLNPSSGLTGPTLRVNYTILQTGILGNRLTTASYTYSPGSNSMPGFGTPSPFANYPPQGMASPYMMANQGYSPPMMGGPSMGYGNNGGALSPASYSTGYISPLNPYSNPNGMPGFPTGNFNSPLANNSFNPYLNNNPGNGFVPNFNTNLGNGLNPNVNNMPFNGLNPNVNNMPFNGLNPNVNNMPFNGLNPNVNNMPFNGLNPNVNNMPFNGLNPNVNNMPFNGLNPNVNNMPFNGLNPNVNNMPFNGLNPNVNNMPFNGLNPNVNNFGLPGNGLRPW